MLFGAIAVTGINEFLTDEQAWTWFLTASEATKAVLCLFIPLRWVKWTGFAFFFSQTLDEIMGGNLSAAGQWEYVLLAVFAVAAFYLTRNDPSRQ